MIPNYDSPLSWNGAPQLGGTPGQNLSQSMASWMPGNNSYVAGPSTATPDPIAMASGGAVQDFYTPGMGAVTDPAGGGGLSNFFGKASNGDFGSLQGWGSAINGIGSLVQGWNGLQQTKLAKKQFNFSKDMANRNLANQAAVTNQALRDRRSGRRAVFGGNKGTGAQVSGAPV